MIPQLAATLCDCRREVVERRRRLANGNRTTIRGGSPRRAEKQRDRILITRNGKPAALLVSVGEWESINETLDVLRDPEALKDIQEADEAYARGEVFGNEDIAEIMRARIDDVGPVA